ncbi:hypothetical protein NX059_007015 [Plenodomus lindquistii]|nr:hypothetical protein NX059_007015 [Plenodomus lindquistii]
MGVTSMDPVTAQLAVELQLADIDTLLDDHYENEKLVDSDTRANFRFLQDDLRSKLETLEGQVLSLKVLRDQHDERVAFNHLLEQERQAVEDHQLAMQLAGLATTHHDVKHSQDYGASIQDNVEDDGDIEWRQLKELYATALELHTASRASVNVAQATDVASTEASRSADGVEIEAFIQCVACMEAVPSSTALTLACEPEAHTYCRLCLVDLYEKSLVDTLLFPPRCCKLPIPLDICRAMLPKDLAKNFDLKVEELATPNPTYCSNADCSRFIRVNNIRSEIGTCVYCHDKTCVRCKLTEHEGLCPEDPNVQLLMAVAKRVKWQQCNNCKNMIELAQGCFHMQ